MPAVPRKVSENPAARCRATGGGDTAVGAWESNPASARRRTGFVETLAGALDSKSLLSIGRAGMQGSVTAVGAGTAGAPAEGGAGRGLGGSSLAASAGITA